MTQSDTQLLPLVARYIYPVTRLVSRQLLDKEQATTIVSIVFEDLYDNGHFYEGPQLRAALLQRIKWACILANKIGNSKQESTSGADFLNGSAEDRLGLRAGTEN